MERRFHTNPFVPEQEDLEPTTTQENGADSPLSGDDTTVTNAPSPKRSKRSVQKRVVSVPIGDVDGSRSKGEVYPPSDSWAWRKYGQKPIKGSPYPRGYYRCSSSKGCPARKQVERSRVDPTMLVITYACDHNHSLPTSKHHHRITAATASSSTSTAKFPPEKIAVLANQPDLEPGNSFSYLTDEFGWFSDVASPSAIVLESPVYVGPICADADVAVMFTMGEEDESLFADLGELPEYSVVFRRSDEHSRQCSVETPCCGSTG
uniref:Putative WRKY transcription factor 65 n=1 Tax=Davidia involucrata TaxID=16924 RepID=A0A5B7C012_DAVIN